MLTEQVYSVTQLTQAIKDLLEQSFTSLWVEGEVSNFRAPSSGHFYFTLKDDAAQVSAVLFRGHALGLRFRPEDGQKVLAMTPAGGSLPAAEFEASGASFDVDHLEGRIAIVINGKTYNPDLEETHHDD